MTAWKPQGYPSLSPYLIAAEPDRLIAFLVEVFYAVPIRRIDRPDGSLMHAEVRLDDSIVMIGGAATNFQSRDVHLHLYVPDASAVHDRAIAAGAEPVQAPVRKAPEDDLRGGFRDPAGHVWWVATE